VNVARVASVSGPQMSLLGLPVKGPTGKFNPQVVRVYKIMEHICMLLQIDQLWVPVPGIGRNKKFYRPNVCMSRSLLLVGNIGWACLMCDHDGLVYGGGVGVVVPVPAEPGAHH
jgi:hypothetical protein